MAAEEDMDVVGAAPLFDTMVVVGFDDDDDHDSFMDSSASSLRESTASLNDSVHQFRTIHGRTYQISETTDYWAPNDEAHIEGFDITHHYLLILMKNKLFGAPIKDDHLKILDVGAGTGVWAIDMAEEFPNSEVIGTDISNIQPEWVPVNCFFQIHDAQLKWTFRQNYFDFIHARNLFGGINDWQRLYDQAYTHLKPGGWFESLEADSQVRSLNPAIENDPSHIFKQWAPLFWEAGDITGQTFRVAQDDGRNPIMMVECMKKAGFVDIVHKRWSIPVGGWAKDRMLKEVGFYAAWYVDQGLEGWALRPISEILGWSYPRLLVFIENMRKALEQRGSLPYFNYHMVYGRKPEFAI
ncbi:UMTA protein [Colletotrichum gloeosporioides Cg-14]|uniref:UMTA protein n=1 Tax=Colletotrichum gloeosporioides (strain Cg-14) TaxID=1237896 RepID=T0M5T0_COLGC|nr:UMTA protein [Colletotrichum gloeosporioides Cg-14]